MILRLWMELVRLPPTTRVEGCDALNILHTAKHEDGGIRSTRRQSQCE